MIIRILALVMLSWIVGFIVFAVSLPLPLDDRETDAIVVLTGAPMRIERGLEAVEKDWSKAMLITGVDRQVLREELVAQYPDHEATFNCCIDLGFAAVDTRTNALEMARWVAKGEYDSVRLITSDWHMHRAAFEIERAMPDNVTIYRDAVRGEPSLRVLFTEYNKYLLRLAGALTGI
ncbi:MAG: YdcF family protein [Pseudomonadota bacterium]